MISVMNECEIPREPSAASSTTAASDLSFGIESPHQAPKVGDDGASGEAMVPIDLGNSDKLTGASDAEMEMDEAGVSELKSPDAGFERPEARASLESMVPEASLVPYVARVLEGPDGKEWMQGFRVGDMVWGKVKSHPWWPGHIFNEAFASPAVRRTRREGHVLVAFFGDSSYGWFEPAELIPFDPHFLEKSHQTASRNFQKAVEEAVDEASRRAALSVTCCCRNPNNFRPTGIPGYVFVDVAGYEPNGIYSERQIESARNSFNHKDIVSFVHDLALAPRSTVDRDVGFIRNVAMLMAFRKAVYEEFDETYAQAFGVEPVRPSRNELGVVDQPGTFAQRGIFSCMPLSCCFYMLVVNCYTHSCIIFSFHFGVLSYGRYVYLNNVSCNYIIKSLKLSVQSKVAICELVSYYSYSFPFFPPLEAAFGRKCWFTYYWHHFS